MKVKVEEHKVGDEEKNSWVQYWTKAWSH
jgi:hypothetical protein